MKQIIPSLFGADLLHLADEIDFLEKENTQILHIDLMDGNFVSNIAFGTKQIESIKKYTNMSLDVHMMTECPERHVDDLLAIDVDMISIHYETTPHLLLLMKKIRCAGKKAGVVLSPSTPECVLEYLLEDIDYVLVMTVTPGYQGQSFYPSSIKKIRNIKKMIGSRPIDIEVDGGINDIFAQECVQAGAAWIVVGSYLFSGDQHSNYQKLQTAITHS